MPFSLYLEHSSLFFGIELKQYIPRQPFYVLQDETGAWAAILCQQTTQQCYCVITNFLLALPCTQEYSEVYEHVRRARLE